MKFSPRLKAALLICVSLGVAAAPALAQQARPSLPQEIYQVDAPFTQEQTAAVNQYVDYQINQMDIGTSGEIVEARAELIAPLASGGTQEFNDQYSAMVSKKLAGATQLMSGRDEAPPAIDADPAAREEYARRVLIRLNTMIVVARLDKDDQVLSLIIQGVGDVNSAVRYWAARAARIGQGASINAQQSRSLIVGLGEAIKKENAEDVVRQFLLALIELEAVNEAQQGLNDLVGQHIGQANMRFAPKREAMRALLQKLQVMDASGQPVEPQFRQLARAACRYMILITNQAPGANLAQELERDHLAMVQLCDQVLRAAHKRFQSAVAAPASVDSAIFGRNWPTLKTAALTWRDVLKQPPFSFTDVDLAPAGN